MQTATVAIDVPTRKAPPMPRHGVDTPNLLATIGVVAKQPELAKFQFRATNRWVSGTHSRGTVESFYGAGTEHAHKRTFTLEADHPAVLVGADTAPLPVEISINAE